MTITTNIIQWNCNGLTGKYEELKILINKYQPLVICIQESKLLPTKKFNLKNYNIFRKDFENSNRACGGVLTAVHKSVVSELIPTVSPIQSILVKVFLHFPIFLGNIYLPPENLVERDLISFLNSIPSPYIVMGDINGHHTSWGSTYCSTRGNIIRRIIDTTDSIILNTGTPTYLSPAYNTFSCIDLSWCSPTIYTHLNWHVSEDQYSSDHFPLIISFPNNNTRITKQPKWITEKADWTIFQNHIKINKTDITTANNNSDKINNIFTTSILSAAELAIPKTSSTILSNKRVPWYDSECKLAIKKRRRALKAFQNEPTLSNLIEYKKNRSISRRIIKNKKKESWEQFLNNISANPSPRVFWKKIQSITGKYTDYQPSLLINEHVEQNPSTLAEHFATFFSNIYTPQTSISEDIDLDNINIQTNCVYNLPITRAELIRNIKELKSTSPGVDEVHNEMLKNLPNPALDALLALYNHIWSTGDFPELWRRSIIIPILKPGKNKLVPSSYRPIALTSCMCKLLEKIVFKRLIWILERNNLLSNAQCGFRKGRSTIDHLVTMEHDILSSFAEKKECIGIYFDIEKAYDNLNPLLVLQQLREWRIQGRILSLIKNFLQSRTFQVRIGNHLSSARVMNNGIPQGSVLSCALFAIAINKITYIIPKSIRTFLFVDDLALLLPFKNRNMMEKILKKCLSQLETWSTQSGLKFSIDKTKCILFSKLRTPTPPPELTYRNLKLKFEPNVRFLGLILNCRLDWKDHIRWLKEESLKRLNVLRVLAGCSWGADRSSMIKVYTSLIRSKIDYGCIVYSSANLKMLSTLDSVHHAGIRLATGAFRTSPVSSLCVEAGLAPLVVRRYQLACGYIGRLKFNHNNPAWKPIFQPKSRRFSENHKLPAPLGIRAGRYIEKIRHLQTTTEEFNYPPWTIELPLLDMTLSNHRKNNTSNFTYLAGYQKIKNKFRNSTFIYTDGSKSNNDVGCSIVTESNKILYKLPPETSNFTAECHAISAALYHIMQLPKDVFVIFTDSLSAMKAITDIYTDDLIIKKIHAYSTMINDLNKKVVIAWIPSHMGITGNEAADRAAREAALSSLDITNIYTVSDIRSSLKSQAKSTWDQLWENTEGVNKLKRIKQGTKSWISSSRQNRREEVVIARLRIGHTRLTHSFLIDRTPPPQCEACNVQLTIEHILENCPSNSNSFKNNERKLHILLGNNSTYIEKIIKFLKEKNLFHKI